MMHTIQASKTTIIAEVGSVHDGSLGNALKLIEAAAASGADAVKFQTHISAAETIRNAPMPPYFKGEPRFEYFDRTGFTLDQWKQLKGECDERAVEFMSSPFSVEAVDLLEKIGVARYKVGSGEVTNMPLLERIGQTGKPVIVSSGMSTWAELDEAVATLRRFHNQIVLLQCTSEYPCPYEEVGLNIMLEMRERYDLPVGLSDHTLTPFACLAAVTLGASVLEKHFTFSRLMYGSDARHSTEPAEFATLVEGVRAVETMRDVRVEKDATAERLRFMKEIFEKSVVSQTAIAAGTRITAEMVAVKKPGTGIPARRLREVIGSVAARAIDPDSVIQPGDLQGWAGG